MPPIIPEITELVFVVPLLLLLIRDVLNTLPVVVEII